MRLKTIALVVVFLAQAALPTWTAANQASSLDLPDLEDRIDKINPTTLLTELVNGDFDDSRLPAGYTNAHITPIGIGLDETIAQHLIGLVNWDIDGAGSPFVTYIIYDEPDNAKTTFDDQVQELATSGQVGSITLTSGGVATTYSNADASSALLQLGRLLIIGQVTPNEIPDMSPSSLAIEVLQVALDRANDVIFNCNEEEIAGQAVCSQ